LGEAWVKEKSFSSTLRRKRSGTLTLQLLTPPLLMLGSLKGNVTSTSHLNALKDVPRRGEWLNNLENYLPTNDELYGEGRA